ncbi:MAG TPA: hypothetical protein VNO84_13845 [Burkholderiaceae bacterium]|nr:hypothetical protein [Burkholderiaceae bacterium]
MIARAALLLTVGATALYLYRRTRLPSSSLPQTTAAGSQGLPPDAALTGSAEGLNPAESLESRNRMGSPIGSDTAYGEQVRDDDLFGSSSQEGTTPKTPGLGDYSRGA